MALTPSKNLAAPVFERFETDADPVESWRAREGLTTRFVIDQPIVTFAGLGMPTVSVGQGHHARSETITGRRAGRPTGQLHLYAGGSAV